MPRILGIRAVSSALDRILIYLTLLSIGFALFTLAFSLASLIVTAAGTDKVLPSVVAGFLASPALTTKAMLFFLALIGIHVALATVWYFLWQPIGRRLPQGSQDKERIALLAFTPVLLLILLTNHRLYPQSNFAFTPLSERAEFAVTSLWIVAVLYIVGILMVSSWFGLRAVKTFITRKRFPTPVTGIIPAIIALAGGTYLLPSLSSDNKAVSDRNQPDILLIGVDSIRTDHVGFLNDMEESLTPAMDDFLANAAVFEHAWTPLGRTYPAWVSILTGQHPSTHGAVFNLVSRERVDDNASLPHQLGAEGYQRIYAIDETRFSNLDESYGFDEVIAPAIGASDFLIGTIGDLPMVNLLANTPPGRFLFPDIHMNRAVGKLYRPATFDHALKRGIESLDPDKPLFLAAHFELPHWPYTWSNWEQTDFKVPTGNKVDHKAYQAAVLRADTQVRDLLRALEREGRLNNAIVVLLSDHGEAFDSTKPSWQGQGDVKRSRVPDHAGHGTSAISKAQNNVILGFRGFGAQKETVATLRDSATTVSLVDIRPTLHDWLRMPVPKGTNLEGISLFPILTTQDASHLEQRAITLETGFSPPSITAGNPHSEALIEEAVEYYDVTQRGRLEMQEQWVSYLMRKKQRAALSGRWALGAFPVSREANEWALTLADFDTYRYWDARQVQGLPESARAPAQDLLNALCERFRFDPGFNLPECVNSPFELAPIQ